MEHTLKKAHDRVYRTFWQDGLLDVFAGLALVGVGISWVTGYHGLGAVCPAIAVPLWSVFRKRLVEPRLGHVRFDEEREQRVRLSLGTLVGTGCGFFLVAVYLYWVISSNPPAIKLESYIAALPAVLVGIGGWLCAFMFGIHRLAFYGAVCVVAGVVIVFLELDPGWSLLASGALTAIAGGVLLVKFLSSFPRLSQEME